MLHITNGDIVVELLQRAGFTGVCLPWQDVLHEGPIPAHLALSQLSLIRAQYIAGCHWGDYASLQIEFQTRDAELAHYQQHEEVILWFDTDLYDQLQLLQLLDYFSHEINRTTPLSLINIISNDQLKDINSAQQLYAQRQFVTPVQLKLAQEIWQLIRSDDPTLLGACLTTKDFSCLPYLKSAIKRYLEEFPWINNGLSKTQQLILKALEQGAIYPVAIFEAVQQMEEIPFMGDWSLWRYIAALIQCERPLIRVCNSDEFIFPPIATNLEIFNQQTLAITDYGLQLLMGKPMPNDYSLTMDRWLGGVHLHRNNLWGWNADSQKIEKIHI